MDNCEQNNIDTSQLASFLNYFQDQMNLYMGSLFHYSVTPHFESEPNGLIYYQNTNKYHMIHDTTVEALSRDSIARFMLPDSCYYRV